MARFLWTGIQVDREQLQALAELLEFESNPALESVRERVHVELAKVARMDADMDAQIARAEDPLEQLWRTSE